MLPGLLPLSAYGIASELWGDIVGLAIGDDLGLIEPTVISIRQRRLDWFVLSDISLIVVVAIVSAIQTNDLVFKLKSACIELIMAVLIAVSAFGLRNLLLGMALRGKAGQKLRQTWGRSSGPIDRFASCQLAYAQLS